MKGFFDTIPKDLDESAKVDGATHAQIFFGIILPLVAPILAVTGLLVLHRRDQRVPDRQHVPDPGRLRRPRRSACTAWSPAERNEQLRDVRGRRAAHRHPDGALFQFLQRYIVGGLTAGAVKG